MKSKLNTRWENVTGEFKTTARNYYLPETIDDVVKAVKEAESKMLPIRAVGSGHSFNDCAITDGILLDLCKMTGVTRTPLGDKRPIAQFMHLATMQPGTVLSDMNKELDKLGLAMFTLGAIDHQTISGALATGTHGCAPEIPPLPGVVRSMLLVASAGRKFRIEPAQGITDPVKHQEPGVQLLQDDNAFYSALIHLGAFGIVCELVIEVEPQYYLYEKRSIEPWDKLRKSIEDGSLFARYQIKLEDKFTNLPPIGCNIFVNPYVVEGKRSAMVGRIFKLDHKPSVGLLESSRNILLNIAAATFIPYSALVRMANKNPQKLPQSLEFGIKNMRDEAFVAKSYHVWLQGMEAVAVKGFGAEFAYDATTSEWLQKMDAVFAHYEKLKQEGLYTPGPPMIRFTGGSEAFLDPSQNRRTVWIGTPTLIEYHRSHELLDSFQELHYSLGGRVHWGKMNNRISAHPGMLEKWYPKLGVWKEQMLKFNPRGTFSNAFTRRQGLTP